ncbi:MAG: type ISP restriction/modification enzyme [Ginsengibacter sp.]
MTINQYIQNISENFKRGIPTSRTFFVESSVVISPEIIGQISKALELSFINDEEMERTGEVCFANSPEVRPEFRLTFTSKDAIDYLYAVLYSAEFHKEFEKHLKLDLRSIPIPADIFIFCKLAVLGSDLQKIHRLGNPLLQMKEAFIESQKLIEKIDSIILHDK